MRKTQLCALPLFEGGGTVWYRELTLSQAGVGVGVTLGLPVRIACLPDSSRQAAQFLCGVGHAKAHTSYTYKVTGCGPDGRPLPLWTIKSLDKLTSVGGEVPQEVMDLWDQYVVMRRTVPAGGRGYKAPKGEGSGAVATVTGTGTTAQAAGKVTTAQAAGSGKGVRADILYSVPEASTSGPPHHMVHLNSATVQAVRDEVHQAIEGGVAQVKGYLEGSASRKRERDAEKVAKQLAEATTEVGRLQGIMEAQAVQLEGERKRSKVLGDENVQVQQRNAELLVENATLQEKVLSARLAEDRAKESQDRLMDILHTQSKTNTPSPAK